MPELPEVETVARQLAPLITGRRIRSVSVNDHRLHSQRGLPLDRRNLPGWTAAGVARCGKQVVVELARAGHDSRWLVVHLRMTGRLIFVPEAGRPPATEPRLLVRFDSGSLGLYDSRRFGTVELHVDPASFRPSGLDPLSATFSAAHLTELLAGCRQDIKTWLLRQDKLVGLGNIYACEVLHRAGISPLRSAASLSRAESGKLARVTRSVLQAAIRHCGTTFSDFQDAQGHVGGYQRYLQVYGRAGQPCRSCGGSVLRLVQQQRGTFYCPLCQL